MSAVTAWYASQCDGDWEHEHGIRIETLDNPGWSVEIDLEETGLSGITLDRTAAADGDSWIQAWSDGSAFHLRCGPADLGRALERFRDFAALHAP
ncbi:Imm53 family immunity protein [Streptomyces sp. NRRL F-4489]|uniref:Imm53 family immunity protein n=1 Tax=Streptomyces sp. NRRL F-4489 TaxID=1609095 RepID=UPI0008306F00|nr:Imm53 family immunity protein [Streptomyces sp. NRRL F-4489]